MVIDRTNKVDGTSGVHNVETVKEIFYVGVHLNGDGNSATEIKRRIALSKSAITKLNKNWKDKQITTPTKRKLVALYGAEA